MIITGEALIGGSAVRGASASFLATNAASGAAMEPAFFGVDTLQIDRACQLADAAFDIYRATGNEQRAQFLLTIGEQILALGDALIERAMAESGLPRARLEGERGRTVAQLTLFAVLLREGSWRDVRIDSALPTRQPPRPELRMQLIGLGPVAVFGASNFPLAFSVAGGDTASALAAGCPVVVKAHPAHPGTSELVGRAIQEAARLCDLPAGVFALLTGNGNEVGAELVRHPLITAVGFTGSRAGGMALMTIAAARPVPIPVFAEMSSINPQFLLPQALAQRTAEIATGFAASLTMGVGQFCTNPGLVLAVQGDDFDSFSQQVQQTLQAAAPSTMLSAAIAGNFSKALEQLAAQPGVTAVLNPSQSARCGTPAIFITDGSRFLSNPVLAHEMFGPAAVLLRCTDTAQMLQIARQLEGQLTATLHMDEADLDTARTLLPVLERKAGRVLVNGFPTGVEVATAMVHGGPFPATSNSQTTSVGTAAIQRFLRPVCYQNLPQALLPESLQDGQVQAGWYRRDGALSKS